MLCRHVIDVHLFHSGFIISRCFTHSSGTSTKYNKEHSSSYHGVSLVKANGKYLAQIWHSPSLKLYCGVYDLECDAAFAYDKAAILVKDSSKFHKFNFVNESQYSAARSKEGKERRISISSVDVLAEIEDKVSRLRSKIEEEAAR